MMQSRVEMVPHMEELMPLITEVLENGGSVRFHPRGTSMLPMLRQDIDSVVLSPIRGDLRKYDLPLYQRDNGKYVLHRIVGAGNTYTCAGDNQFVFESGIRRDQMIAVVTAFFRGNREITVSAVPYQLYCRVWHYSRPLRRFWCRGIGWIQRHLIHKDV